MKVYGLDFTSSPDQGDKPRLKDKLLTLADCELIKSQLTVNSFRPLTGKRTARFEKFEGWLQNDEGPWICGIDFPFGMPLGAIEYCRWLQGEAMQNWATYVKAIHNESNEVDDFKDRVERWSKTSKKGDWKRVFLLRYTDRIGGFGGSSPSSPMKVHTQCNPPVGRMFFEGSKRLLASNVSVQPVRPNNDQRIVVETYPRLAADKFVNGKKYKDAKKGDDAAKIKKRRTQILDALGKTNPYGVTVTFADKDDRDKCVDDGKGDYLDSVLCAVQAAWSYLQEKENQDAESEPTQRYGIPIFVSQCMKQLVQLEGWIVDPLLIASATANDSEATA